MAWGLFRAAAMLIDVDAVSKFFNFSGNGIDKERRMAPSIFCMRLLKSGLLQLERAFLSRWRFGVFIG